MPLFSSRRPIQPEFLTATAELSVHQRLAEMQSRTDAALRLIDAFAAGPDPDVRDAVLEIRLALRPAVPVVPGYADRAAANYWENP
jgi:hypothetical protein